LVCKAGDSESGAGNGGGVCANASALHNAREVAMSKRAPRGATEVCGRKRGTAVLLSRPRPNAGRPRLVKKRARPRALVNGS